MDNFIFGILGVFRGIEESVRLLYYSPSVRGFVIGFIVATLFFAFIITDQPEEEKKPKIQKKDKRSQYLLLAIKLLFGVGLVLFNLILLLFFFFYVISIT